MAGVTKTAELASVFKETYAFRYMLKTSVCRVGNCERKLTFDDCDACALVRYIKIATLLQVTENVNAGHDQTVSARIVHR